ncbi:MAG: ATP-binding cassette domain-containing protein [Planctomycetota bacterium]
MTKLHLHQRVTTSVKPTPRIAEIAAMFGLGLDTAQTIDVVPPIELRLRAGDVVFVTGPSGSGKSTILRLIAEQLHADQTIDLDRVEVPTGQTLVELWDEPLPQTINRLSTAGMADAFVMLRRPEQLSDGQRFRLRLAAAIRETERTRQTPSANPDRFPVLLADEFCATLDRPTAHAIARGLAKWARRSNTTVVAASTHDDLLEPLAPDTLIVQALDGTIEVLTQ